VLCGAGEWEWLFSFFHEGLKKRTLTTHPSILSPSLQTHQGPSAAAVLAGDFNAPPTSLELALLASLLPPGSADAWATAGGGNGDGGSSGGFTANVPGGTYTTTGAGKRPARLDYLFSVGTGATPVEATVSMHLDPATGRSFSDHAGVEAVFVIGEGGGGGGGQNGNGWEAVEAPPPAAAADASTPSPSKRGPGAWLGSLSGGRRTPGGSGGSGGRRRREVGADQQQQGPAAPTAPTTTSSTTTTAPLAAAAPLIEATAARMRCAADGAGFGAAVSAVVAAAALAVLIAGAAAGPRFRLPVGAAVPLLAVLTASALAAPCLATAGYVDRHAQAAALGAVAREVRILLAASAGRAGDATAVVAAAAPPPQPAGASHRPRPAPVVPPPPPQHLRAPAFSYA
jgi:hypothetical protein